MTASTLLSPEGFRTAAYLEARARVDALRRKTTKEIKCNPPNKPCGGRCIPPAWDCRLKNEGSDAHLRAVKTDPLGGLASIERGSRRLAKGIAKGSFSDVEGGKNAIIRGAVKIAPGNIQEKKELTAKLRDRTAAIGVGLAVLTGGIGAHAILMRAAWYRQGVGGRINEAVPRGISAVLDSLPVIGAERARVRSAATVATRAAAERATTNLSSSPEVLASRMGQGGETVLGSTRAGASTALSTAVKAVDAQGSANNLFNWNAKHRNAFWNATVKADDIVEQKANGEKVEIRINVFARPTAEAYLASQYNLSSIETADTQTLRNAIQARISEERDNYIRLAKQQGYRIQKTGGKETVHPDDLGRFITRNRPLSTQGERYSRPMRDEMDNYVRSVLTTPSSEVQRKVYRDTVTGFNSFYKSFGDDTQTVAGASAANIFGAERNFNDVVGKDARARGGYEDLRITADIARARYLAPKLKITQEVVGPNHAELITTAYYHQKVAGTGKSPYTITDRLAVAAASELTGRTVGPREAFSLLNQQYGFPRVRRVAAAPRQRGERVRPMTEAEAVYQLMRTEGLSRKAALAEVRRRRERGDALPPRVRAYLEVRTDLRGESRLGKPCGESHIPKAHTCRKGKGAQPVPETKNNSKIKTVATVAAAAGAVAALGVAAANSKEVRKNVEFAKFKLTTTILDGLSSELVDKVVTKLPADKQSDVQKLRGYAKKAVAHVYYRSRGAQIMSVDVKNNFTNWKTRNGDVLSIGSVEDSLIIFESRKSDALLRNTNTYDVMFSIDTKFDAQSKSASKNAMSVAKTVKRMFKAQVDLIPDNSVMRAIAYDKDAKGEKRASVYEKFGFKAGIGGDKHLWAMKRKQTFTSVNPTQLRQLSSLASIPKDLNISGSETQTTKTRTRGDAELAAKGKPCGASYISKERNCRKGQATPPTPEQPPTPENSNSSKTRKLLSRTGIVVAGAVLGILAKDVFTSGVFDDKNPPKKAPEGLYDTFQPGDLLYQTNNFAGANRAHYVVYVGKIDGTHRVFDTTLSTITGKISSRMSVRPIDEAQNTGTSFAPATRADKDAAKKPSSEQLNKIIARLANKNYDWTGFETNCETLARTIVNDLPISTQAQSVTRLTGRFTTALVDQLSRRLAPAGYRKRAVKQKNVENLVKRTVNPPKAALASV